MTTITQSQYVALVKKIYASLMALENMGMGEMGDCQDEAERIVDTWMEENNIDFENLGF